MNATTDLPIYLTESQLLERFPFIAQSQLRKGRLQRSPVDCPPHIRLSARSIIYRLEDVVAWIEGKAAQRIPAPRPAAPSYKDSSKRRGRPTKAEQMARQEAAPQQAAE